MFPRARSTLALAATLLALAMQWCVPLAHAVHEASVQSIHRDAAHESHHHHDSAEHAEHSEHRHDESQCPTCQQFVALRAFTPTVAPVTLAAAGAWSMVRASHYAEPFVSHFAHAPAVPRGPPVG